MVMVHLLVLQVVLVSVCLVGFELLSWVFGWWFAIGSVDVFGMVLW